MNRIRYPPLLWVGLGATIIVFYVTFVTARTYYNPAATTLIIVLGVVIALSGLISMRLKPVDFRTYQNTFVSRTISFYPAFFASAIVALAADILITLYAISQFGPAVEANKVVMLLATNGQWFAWIGQQFTPLILAGLVFAVQRNYYIRSMMTFYTVGTLGYAAATVLNDLIVVYRLQNA